MAQQQLLFDQQQQQILQMQQQIIDLTNLLKTQSLNVSTAQNTVMKNLQQKRGHSSSEDEDTPSEKRAPSSRQEDKASASSEETMETPPGVEDTPEEAVDGRRRTNHPLNPSRDSSTPSTGRAVKERGEAGSSVSSGNRRGDVSNNKKHTNKAKPNIITAPSRPFR